MGVNVVSYGGETLVDMTDATITEDTVLEGYTGYGADGELVVGTAKTTKQYSVNITIPADGWEDNTQTVAVDIVTAGCTVIIGGDYGSEPEYSRCGVWCSAQADGALTFQCSRVPGTDVVADAVIFV